MAPPSTECVRFRNDLRQAVGRIEEAVAARRQEIQHDRTMCLSSLQQVEQALRPPAAAATEGFRLPRLRF